MSVTETLLSAAARLQDLPNVYKVERSMWELHPHGENEKIRNMPDLTTNEDFTEHEYHLNCLNYAHQNIQKIQRCFVEVGDRQLVAEFLSSCQSAASGDVWRRTAKLCDALQRALLRINAKTSDKYKGLQVCIFSRAYTESHPPRKHKHWGYADTTDKLEFLCQSLTEAVDHILSATKPVQDMIMPKEELRWHLVQDKDASQRSRRLVSV